MDVVNLPLLPFVAINFGLALFVLLQNKKSLVNQTFTGFILSVTFWTLTNLGIDNFKIVGNPIFWTNFAFAIGIFIPLFFLLFSLAFLNKIRYPLNLRLSILISVPILSIFFISFSNLIVAKVVIDNDIVEVFPGILNSVWYLIFVVYFVFGLGYFLKEFNRGSALRKQQLRYLLLGTVATLSLGLLINFILPIIQGSLGVLASYTPYTLILMETSIAYAIVKHRLLDIRLVVARTIAYSLLILTIAVFYIGSTVLLTNFLFKTTTSGAQLLLYAALTLVVAFTFQPLRTFLEEATDKVFFKGAYDSNILLANLTKVMAEAILIDDIAHRLLEKILKEMRISQGAFVLTDAGKIFVTEPQGYKEEPKFEEKDIFSLQALDKNLIFEDLEEGAAKELMRKLNVLVVIPLKTQVDHVGVMLLGEKASGEIYSSKDISVLEIFAPEAAISFENAKSVEKIRRFNITLKEQVERATHQLKDANEQLKQLDKLKDEFLSIASHDLRTPMTAIKSYLWMAVNGRAGELNPKLKKYLDISYSSAERMITLINDLLNMSRIDAGRVEMNFEDVEFKTIVDQVFAEITGKADEKSIQLKYEEDTKFPHVILDRQRFPEILQNLVGNAVKFTPEKGIITVKAKRSHEEGFVEISVSDTGVGIPKADMPKLFSKFGRLDSPYTAVSATGGTGLGLYISKSFVEQHGGKIWVDSVEGKGTTFTFTLREANPVSLKKMVEEGKLPAGKPVIPLVK